MAASMYGLGKTVVPTPGVPVQILPTAAFRGPGTPGEDTAHALLLQALSGNTGKIYIGTVGLDKSPLANCLVVLPVPTTNLLPTFSIAVSAAANALSLSDLRIDADNANEGVLVSVVVV